MEKLEGKVEEKGWGKIIFENLLLGCAAIPFIKPVESFTNGLCNQIEYLYHHPEYTETAKSFIKYLIN